MHSFFNYLCIFLIAQQIDFVSFHPLYFTLYAILYTTHMHFSFATQKFNESSFLTKTNQNQNQTQPINYAQQILLIY